MRSLLPTHYVPHIHRTDPSVTTRGLLAAQRLQPGGGHGAGVTNTR